MSEEKEILVPVWVLEQIEDTLRIAWNQSKEYEDETCQDRNVRESLNFVRKLLKGEEITGLERWQPLIK